MPQKQGTSATGGTVDPAEVVGLVPWYPVYTWFGVIDMGIYGTCREKASSKADLRDALGCLRTMGLVPVNHRNKKKNQPTAIKHACLGTSKENAGMVNGKIKL